MSIVGTHLATSLQCLGYVAFEASSRWQVKWQLLASPLWGEEQEK